MPETKWYCDCFGLDFDLKHSLKTHCFFCMCLNAVCNALITKTSRLFLPALTPLSYNALCVRSRVFQLKAPKLQLFASVSCICGGNLLTLCLFPRRGGRGQRCWAAAAASPCPPRYGCCGGLPAPAATPLAAIVHPPRGTVGQREESRFAPSLPDCAVCGPSVTCAVRQHPSSLEVCVCLVLCRPFHTLSCGTSRSPTSLSVVLLPCCYI